MNTEQEIRLELDRWRGYSAYELAVRNGYDGTEEEWLESLKNKDALNLTVDGKPAGEGGAVWVYPEDIPMSEGSEETLAQALNQKANLTSVPMVENSLTSEDAGKALSAAKGKELKEELDEKASVWHVTASVPVSEWSENETRGGVSAAVSVPELLVTDVPKVDVRTMGTETAEDAEALQSEWAAVYGVEAANGWLMLHAVQAPETALPILIEIVR